MTTVLGIGVPVHDTGAALVRDGEIVGAVNESRLSRVKREPRFPASAVNHLVSEHPDSVDAIAVSGVTPFSSPYPRRTIRKEIKLHQRGAFSLERTLKNFYDSYREPDALLNEVAGDLAADTRLQGDSDALHDRMSYVDHHRAHAASAYYTSGFPTATVITVDAAGDGYSSTVWVGRDGTLDREATNDDIDSVGKLWAQIPTVFGFKGARHAGKFMGMASYVDAVPSALRDEFKDILRVDGLDIVNTHERRHNDAGYEATVHRLKERLGEYGAPMVSRALQDRTEEVLAEFASAAVARTGVDDIALAGGVVANVKVNQRIYELPGVERIFVHQNMGDGGLGLGAAVDRYAALDDEFRPTRLDDVYLGPEHDDSDVDQALARANIPNEYRIQRFDDRDTLADAAGEMLASGDVVSLYTGRVEYGPRALGNRSILYQPTDPSAIEWLNASLDRTEFMPFAPVTLREDAEQCYEGYDPERCPAAEFMTITFDCTEAMAERSPGVVHVDGTARPQVVDEETNPLYYRIIESYKRRTGIPTLINTSFNIHGEPIVCKPAEALRSFLRTGNDALVMNGTVVRRDAACE